MSCIFSRKPVFGKLRKEWKSIIALPKLRLILIKTSIEKSQRITKNIILVFHFNWESSFRILSTVLSKKSPPWCFYFSLLFIDTSLLSLRFGCCDRLLRGRVADEDRVEDWGLEFGADFGVLHLRLLAS